MKFKFKFKNIIPWFFIISNANAYQKVENPWYIGGGVGYGSTTWDALVPQSSEQNSAISMSTPIRVQEGGVLWGFSGGVEIFKNFQLEFNYWNYPKATIYFDPDSLYTFENDESTEFTSNTYTMSLQGKFLVPWNDSQKLRLFATAGMAWLNRQDDLLIQDTISPTFGLGLNYGFTPNVMGEFGFVYTAGDGQSELNPSADYMPFLYGIFWRLYYRWG